MVNTGIFPARIEEKVRKEGDWEFMCFVYYFYDKFRWENSTNWGGWKSPFSSNAEELCQMMDMEKCAAGTAKWPYEPKFMGSNSEIEARLFRHVQETRAQHMDYLRRIQEFAEIHSFL
jgi:hypothetical protein